MKMWILSWDLRPDAICSLTTFSAISDGEASGFSERNFLVPSMARAAIGRSNKGRVGRDDSLM